MSTSEKIVLAETVGASALVVGFITLVSPGDVWLQSWGMHPMWFVVIFMSSRYAIRGLFSTLALTSLGLIAASYATGGSIAGFIARSQSTLDLLALATAVLVAWVAMAHDGKSSRVSERLTEASDAQRQAEQSVHALHASLGYLRTRHDRLDVSLSLWRNLAGRLERGDASEAAKALLELCEMRAGARVGLVQLRDGKRLTTLACRGHWPATSRPNEDDSDPTVRAAIESRQVTPAGPGATEADSDIAIPVIDDESGAVVGIIALRGVSPDSMRAADLRDLGILGQWVAPALARELRRQFRKAIGELAPPPRRTSQVSTL